MTPHINAKQGDFAETVLLPGDPLRAKFIAENFLTNAKQVTNVRNMLGFTGEYNGQRISVMGSGMGVPSASIYTYELIKFYGVKNVIRVGSSGGLKGSNLRDIIVAVGASTDSGVNKARLGGQNFAATASYDLVKKVDHAAEKHNIKVKFGQCYTEDLFYNPNPEIFGILEKMGILCLEMEAAGIYGVAAELGANALAILTVSDIVATREGLSPEDREKSFTDMMKLALEASTS